MEVYFKCSLNLFLKYAYKKEVKKLPNANNISNFEILIQKYTWSLIILIYVFSFWLKRIFKVNFLNWYLYFQTQKCTYRRLSKLIHFLWNLELHLRYSSSGTSQEVRVKCIIKVLFYFLCFCTSFILLSSHLKHTSIELQDLKYKLRMIKVYLKYTSHSTFSVRKLSSNVII